MLLMQTCEIVKANNLSDKVVVIHGRVEVRLPFFIIAYYILHYVLATWHFLFFHTQNKFGTFLLYGCCRYLYFPWSDVISIFHGANTLLATQHDQDINQVFSLIPLFEYIYISFHTLLVLICIIFSLMLNWQCRMLTLRRRLM